MMFNLTTHTQIDGQELVIKANSATQRYVDEYEEKKAKERKAAMEAKIEAAKKKHEEGEVIDEKALQEESTTGVVAEEQEADNKALEVIMGVVSEREEKSAKQQASNTASDFLKQLEKGDLPGPPPPQDGAGTTDRSRGRDTERDKERDREKDREKDRDRERDAEREKRREMEREYDNRLRDWERYERQKLDAKDMERRRQEQGERERFRQCRADLDMSDSEDEVPQWARKPYRTSRRCLERRRRRAAEEEADALDRNREQRELEAQAERKRRRAAAGLDTEDTDDAVSGAVSSHVAAAASSRGGMKVEMDEIKPEPSELSAAQQRPLSPQVDETDPIYKAMMAAATSSAHRAAGLPQTTTSHHQAGDRLLYHATHDPHASVKSTHRNIMRSESPPHAAVMHSTPQTNNSHYQQPSQPQPQQPAQAASGRGFGFGSQKRSALTSMFGEDEEEKTKRVLKPIQYSEEEMMVAQDLEREKQQQAAGLPSQQPSDPKAALKALMDKIPTTKEGVWAYPIQWNHYNNDMRQRFKQWVDAKVAQLLGGNEPTVVNFILDLIDQRRSPAEAVSELHMLLESDTETFVMKLYRTIIFEMERAAAGL